MRPIRQSNVPRQTIVKRDHGSIAQPSRLLLDRPGLLVGFWRQDVRRIVDRDPADGQRGDRGHAVSEGTPLPLMRTSH